MLALYKYCAVSHLFLLIYAYFPKKDLREFMTKDTDGIDKSIHKGVVGRNMSVDQDKDLW